MSLKTQLEVVLSVTETGSVLDHEAPTSRVFYRKAITLPSGTAEGQADVRWSSFRTLGASGSEEIDLTTLTGALGNALTFARLTGIIIVSSWNYDIPSQSFGGLTVTRPTNGVPWLDAVGDQLTMGGRGLFVWVSHRGSPPGVAVTPGTGDLIGFEAGISGASFDLHLFGTSA